MNLQIAHIVPSSENGPRGDEGAALCPDLAADPDDFENLILLCKPHHDEVDEFPDHYTTDMLLSWKQAREQGRQEALSNVPGLATEEGLREAIADAISSRDQTLEDTLARLERNDAEAAELLREMRDELMAARHAGHVIDPDTADLVDSASRRLRHLSDDAEAAHNAATQLQSAAQVLSNLEGLPEAIRRAARQMAQAQQFM